VYNRVTQITRIPGMGTVEPEPTTTFTYDTTASPSGLGNPLEWGFDPINTRGRLAKVTHGSLSRSSVFNTPRPAGFRPNQSQPWISIRIRAHWWSNCPSSDTSNGTPRGGSRGSVEQPKLSRADLRSGSICRSERGPTMPWAAPRVRRTAIRCLWPKRRRTTPPVNRPLINSRPTI
jgi:hypothetical protein